MVTTMTWGMTERTGCGDRRRLKGMLVHAGVLAALIAGTAALWSTLALMAALLAAPATTMLTLEREGAWGVVDVMRHGSTVLISSVRPAPAEALGR